MCYFSQVKAVIVTDHRKNVILSTNNTIQLEKEFIESKFDIENFTQNFKRKRIC
jgi:hypothetical protein